MSSNSTEPPRGIYTLAEGRSVQYPTSSVVLPGPQVKGGGLALLEDAQLIETLAHFPRERIPERVVHAKAAGAWGEFECTKDITSWCSAALFSHVGKKTPGQVPHTFKFGKPEDGTFKYVKLHFKAEAGIKNLTNEEAVRLAGEEPDYHIKDMYNAIERGVFPSWTMSLHVMDPKEAETYWWNIFDITKTWPQSDYPLIPVGRLTLNKNLDNYLQDVEQAAFSPSTLIPGIAPSADIRLHARMLSYPDASRYRVGPNYQQLPSNKGLNVYSPYQRDGAMRVDGNHGPDPDYVGKVQRYSSEVTDEDFEQPGVLWGLFKKNGEDEIFIQNLRGHVNKALPEIQEGTIEMFSKVDKGIGKRLEEALSKMADCVDHTPSQAALERKRK